MNLTDVQHCAGAARQVTMARMKRALCAAAMSASLSVSCSYSYGHTYPATRSYSAMGMDSGLAEGGAKRTAQDYGERGLPVYSSVACVYLVKLVLAAAVGAAVAAKPSADSLGVGAALMGIMLFMPNCSATVGYGEEQSTPLPVPRVAPIAPMIAPTIDGAEYGPAQKATQ